MPRGKKLEKPITNKAIKTLEARGPHWKVNKRHATGMGKAGLPDIDACCAGLSVQIEMKRPGGRATALQQHHIAGYESAGAITAICDSVDEVLAVAEKVEERAAALGLIDKLLERTRALAG